jgi:hypothetical protein
VLSVRKAHKMVKGERKWCDDKTARRESVAHKKKAKKATRSAKKPDHRKMPRTARALAVARVGEVIFYSKTEDGEQPLPDDTEGEEELTAVG